MAALPFVRGLILAMVSVSVVACGQKTTSPSQAPQTPQTPAPPASAQLNEPFVFYTSRDNRDEMLIVDREGGEMRVLARYASRSDWSRDGRIAFDSRNTGPKGIFVIYPDGSGQRYIGPGEDPSWSPDGRFIAVSLNMAIYVLDVDGASAPRLVASPPEGMLDAAEPAWSPDGQWIAFSACRYVADPWGDGCGYTGVYAVRPDGSNIPTLLSGGSAHAPAWSPDGRSLAFASDPLQVFTMNYPAGSPRMVASGTLPAWTPDNRLVYQSHDGPGWRLMINDGGVARQLIPDVASTLSYYGDEYISVRR